jgi:pimeloyl-[acyl-carrier protein] methyl ester esterase
LVSFVLLPGLDGTGKLFDSLLAIAGDAHKCVVVRYPENAKSIDELLAVARNAIDALDRPVVIAESFSGAVLARLLSDGKSKMRAAVFVASFVETPRRQLLNLAFCVPEAVARVALPTVITHFCVNGCEDTALRETILRVVEAVPHRTLLVRLGMLRGLELRVIDTTVPVLALQASRDRVLDRFAQSGIHRMIPNAKIEVVEGPHLLLQAEPETCWREIESFVLNLVHS